MILRTPRLPKVKQKFIFDAFLRDLNAKQTALLMHDRWPKKGAHSKKHVPYRQTVDRYFRHYRELIYAADRSPRFEGDVEIDQAFFGGRRQKRDFALVRRLAGLTRKQIIKKVKKLKPERKVEVVGFMQRGGSVYAKVVRDSKADTLIPLIRLVVVQKSTILTDKWPAFNELAADGYKHFAINHSVEYKDRRGRHINGIERFWSFSKDRLRKFSGISRSTMPLHIKECEFRWNHREDLRTALHLLGTGTAPLHRLP